MFSDFARVAMLIARIASLSTNAKENANLIAKAKRELRKYTK